MALYLYQLQITPSDETFLKKVIPILPDALQNKVSRYHFISDQWRVILSDLFVRQALAQELQIDDKSIEIEINNYGKPFLKSQVRQFNLSHAEELIVLATDDTPIGIDIEYIQPLDDLASLARTCFSDEELQAFLTKNKE